MTCRRFSPQWAQIALLIGDRRGLSYEQIGQLLTPRLKKRTVKAYARRMCEMLGDVDAQEALPPRLQVFAWVRHLEWQLKREPSIEDVIQASAERDV